MLLLFMLSSSAFAQNSFQSGIQYVALKEKMTSSDQYENSTLESILRDIEGKYEVYLSYNPQVVAGKTVSREAVVKLQGNSKNVEKWLSSFLKQYQLDCKKVKDKYFIIYPQSKDKPNRLNSIAPLEEYPTMLSSVPSIRPVQSGNYAEKVITGTVISEEDNMGLPGVNVLVKGTTIGSVTDVDGKYRISAPDDATTLIFSSIGYKAQEIEIGSQSVIDIVMSVDIQSLGEVVVIGYGAVKRSDLTGSVSSITSKDIEEIPTNTVSNLLQGRAAGVQVTTGDAAPGGGINIRIRGTSTITGSTEPLYIIDGFPVNSDNDDLYVSGGINEGSAEGSVVTKVKPNALSFINPNDIESIEILKDAAATAIYGSRGANGVVLIKTKRGKAGKTQVNVNYSLGVQEIIRKIDRLDGPAYARRLTEAEINGGVAPQNVSFNGSDEYHPLPENVQTTDWQEELYRVAPVHNLGVAFSGGTDKTQYLLSGKYYDQEGIMVNSGFKDAQVRFNLDQHVSDFFKLSTNMLLSHSVNDRVPTGAGFNYNTVTSALDYDPTINPNWFDETTGLWYTDTKHANQRPTR